jgi:sulfonate transport system substrate-binding protein
VIAATAELNGDSAKAKRLVAETGGFSEDDVEAGWRHHRFTASIPGDLLDVLVLEEEWLASRDNRRARSRDELATLIDTNVYREAIAGVN